MKITFEAPPFDYSKVHGLDHQQHSAPSPTAHPRTRHPACGWFLLQKYSTKIFPPFHGAQGQVVAAEWSAGWSHLCGHAAVAVVVLLLVGFTLSCWCAEIYPSAGFPLPKGILCFDEHLVACVGLETHDDIGALCVVCKHLF